MTFEEVFGALGLKQEIVTLFSDVTVEKVVSNKARNLMKIYISYNRLITKDYIKQAESEILRKLRSEGVSSVKFMEKYSLADNYTLQVWFDNYKDSIGLELMDYDNVLYALFKGSDFSYNEEEGTLVAVVPDNRIYRNKEDELHDVIYRIAHDRFGFDVNFRVEYKQAEKSRYRQDNERLVMLRLDEITQRLNGRPADVDEDGVIIGAVPDENTGSSDNTNGGMAGNANAGKSGAEAGKSGANGSSADKATSSADAKKKEAEKPAAKTAGRTDKYDGKFRKVGNGGTGRGGREFSAFSGKMIKTDNPDVLFNKDFEGPVVNLTDVQDEIGEVIVRGEILSIDSRFFEKSQKHMLKIEISDYTDSLKLKLFLSKEFHEELMPTLSEGMYIMAKGVVSEDKFDRELQMGAIIGIKKTSDWRVKRKDNALNKRVELHLHTKMSDMDGVSDIKTIIKQVKSFGHPALAITDHGNVQAFPVGNHCVEPGEDFKLIYGCEGYLVDDLHDPVTNDKGQTFSDSFVVFDIETTGFSFEKDRILEIGAVRVDNGVVTGRFSEFVNPEIPIPLRIEKLTSINDSMVKDAETIDKVLPRFLEFIEGAYLVAHNADFDTGFIRTKAKKLGLDVDFSYVDTMGISRFLFPDMAKHNLDALCKRMKFVNEHHHRAVDDAEVTYKIYNAMIPLLIEQGITDLESLRVKGVMPKEAVARLHYYHIIIIAKNEIGRRNLYKLVSMSNVEYFHGQPKIPKSMIKKYREGLILGSACERGEVYSALVDGRDDAGLASIVNFYDYLEIQPVANNHFQINSPRYENINSVDDIKDMNRKIVALGEAYNKPVCATCDVHFLNPEDSIYREIILASKKMNDEEPTPLYLRTTEEMLEEFDYLGSDKAYEVVVTNTNLIADKCERITPVRPDKAPPVIENSDELLRTICYNKAHEMYGDPLPKIVEDRLERELKSIIGNGYAVMYIIAQKLVWKSVEDGYLVGSRGSVGSSFAATMSGITEVNPLSPHYYCKKCHYNDFFSEDVKKYAGMAGCDMPDKDCPNCGEKLIKDGFDIPFETFLGFKGDKEPDIDLNFSGEYQPKAHKYTEVIFGAGQTFRAGTITGLADKTAFGLVKHYYEEKNIPKRDGEIVRIAHGCEGVRKTTGQHPGGIVVLPVGQDINSFTALQKPANDMKTEIITTHFEYHSIDHNLLKLDILGHDDPTMIRMLQDLTGLDPVTIPLDDPGVMSLFQNLEALKIKPEDIGGCQLGSLGIPEFGTDFAMGMLLETKPQHFSDLVRIAGLSHGTDVWLGNAQTLLQEGKATISTCIATRDDIMTYLINMGVDAAESFSIMENVRKGKVAKGGCKQWPQWRQDMLDHNVPEWYCWSCERIQYMFPKAHAAAYVMMAWRIAYCKINYPLAYYCAFFSIRAKAFSYEKMCMGRAKLDDEINALRKKSQSEKLSPNEEASLKDMRIVQEMYARGFSFLPIDIYKAQAKNFQIIDGKIMPAFVAIDGMGENAAVMFEEAAKQGKFFSKDDIKQRGGIGQSIIDKLTALGLLDDLPDTNQLSIFDFMRGSNNN